MPLKQTATLTILPAISVSCSQQIGFGYHGTGQEFYLQPLGLSNTITVNLEHFSGASVGQGTPGNGGIPTDEQDRLSQALQVILQQERQCTAADAALDQSALVEQMQGTLQTYFDNVVGPALQAAKTNDSQAQSAVAKAMSFWRQAELFGFSSQEPFTLDIEFIRQSLPTIFKNAYNQAYSRCLNDTSNSARMEEASKMMGAGRTLELLGYSLAKEFPNFNEQVAACVVGDLSLDVDSNATGVDNEGSGTVMISSQSHVTAIVSAQLQPESALLFRQRPAGLRFLLGLHTMGKRLPGLFDRDRKSRDRNCHGDI